MLHIRSFYFWYVLICGGTVFGSVDNTKTTVRKRIDNYQLELVDTPNILSELRPLKALIEISKRMHPSHNLEYFRMPSICMSLKCVLC